MRPDQQRSIVIQVAIVLCALILVSKLFHLQVMSDKYAQKADNISKRIITEYPDRGLITDRFGELIVFNEDAYDLVIHFSRNLKNFDTARFCDLLQIDTATFKKDLEHARKTMYNGKSIYKKNLSQPEFARIQEGLFPFPDFEIETRSDRKYHTPIAAHLLGYVAEISRRDLERDATEYYDVGEYVGKSGIEQFYEQELRGVKGQKYYQVNNLGQIKDRILNGKNDKDARAGKPLQISIDAALQAYGESMMVGKRGSIVAIEPATGEILAMVTAPNYNPEQFAIKNIGKNYSLLVNDPEMPLINRAVNSKYAPGSIFKLVMALIGLEEGVLTENTSFSCNSGFHIGGLTVRCHPHISHTNLKFSIQTSCNNYYCNAFREILHQDRFKNIEEGYNNWAGYLHRFGLGNKLDVDVNQESAGNVPNAEVFHKIHGHNRWNYVRIISMAIGQGELELTPLQMANLAAAIANRGYFYDPHFIRKIDGKASIPKRFTEKHETGVSNYNFEIVIDAMRSVVTGGTGAGSQIPGIEICGKTGTVQNPHGENHSVFICFAPKDNPKIAVACIVENAGYGSTWAAPISTLMIEKFINRDSVTQRPDLYKRVLRPLVGSELKPTGAE
ncbi:MAG: penicillin-binding protein 2 [Bacteroidia bacterium]|jgi:penicillin-binding protein 2